MDNVVQLWNARQSRRLNRHWIDYSERIVILGERFDEAGVLSMTPSGGNALLARLSVFGDEFEEIVTPGEDVTVRLQGAELVVSVRAVERERMLVEFGMPPGSRFRIRLDSEQAAETLHFA